MAKSKKNCACWTKNQKHLHHTRSTTESLVAMSIKWEREIGKKWNSNRESLLLILYLTKEVTQSFWAEIPEAGLSQIAVLCFSDPSQNQCEWIITDSEEGWKPLRALLVKQEAIAWTLYPMNRLLLQTTHIHTEKATHTFIHITHIHHCQ